MTCRTVKIGDQVGIVCSRGQRPRKCSACRERRATKLCDYVVGFHSGVQDPNTCDKPLCDRCAVSVGQDRDYCPSHGLPPRQIGLDL